MADPLHTHFEDIEVGQGPDDGAPGNRAVAQAFAEDQLADRGAQGCLCD